MKSVVRYTSLIFAVATVILVGSLLATHALAATGSTDSSEVPVATPAPKKTKVKTAQSKAAAKPKAKPQASMKTSPKTSKVETAVHKAQAPALAPAPAKSAAGKVKVSFDAANTATDVKPTLKPTSTSGAAASAVGFKAALTPAPSQTLIDSWEAPKWGEFSPTIALRSVMDLGRKYELETIGGKNYSWLTELRIGIKHSSGWGFILTGRQSTESYDDTTKDVHTYTDASAIIPHPVWYKDNTVSVGGSFRFYYPTSPHSYSVSKYTYAYYNTLSWEVTPELNIGNYLIPRYFQQATYADDDATLYIEDDTPIMYKLASWVSIGVGQYTQYEWHKVTAMGSETDVYPVIDFNLNDNVTLEGRFYMPVYIYNSVGGGATATDLENSYGELFFSMSI